MEESVYQAGPITGVEIDFQWRNDSGRALESQGFRVLNPLRGKDPENITEKGLMYNGELCNVDMAHRDHQDLDEASIVLAYFP